MRDRSSNKKSFVSTTPSTRHGWPPWARTPKPWLFRAPCAGIARTGSCCTGIAPLCSVDRRTSSDDRADGFLEANDMIACDLRGGVGIPGSDRPQQGGVLAHVAGHRRQPIEEKAEDPGGEIVVAHQHVL